MANNDETRGASDKDVENPNVSAATSVPENELKSISPYDVFEKCIIRAENLISVHEATQKIDAISEQHYCDCYRAAVVLTISALDAFIRKIIVSEIRNILSDSSKSLSPELSEYIKSLLSTDKLLDAARNYDILDKVEEAVKEDFETKSFQGEFKIKIHLKMVGYPDIFKTVSEKADINERNLTTKLAKFTKRRHVIAHSGDYDLNQTTLTENTIDAVLRPLDR